MKLLFFTLPFLLQWTPSGWREVLVDIDPKNQRQRLLRFVLAPGPTPASAAYTNLLPPPPLAEGEQGEVCPEGLVAMEELAMRVKESGGAALIADYGDMEIRRHTLRVSGYHPMSSPPCHLLLFCCLVEVILSFEEGLSYRVSRTTSCTMCLLPPAPQILRLTSTLEHSKEQPPHKVATNALAPV